MGINCGRTQRRGEDAAGRTWVQAGTRGPAVGADREGLRAGRDRGEEERHHREGGLTGTGGGAAGPGHQEAPLPRSPRPIHPRVRREEGPGRVGAGTTGRWQPAWWTRGGAGGAGGLPTIQAGVRSAGRGRRQFRNPRGHVGAVVTGNADGKCQGLAQQCRLRPESRRCVGGWAAADPVSSASLSQRR